MKHDWNQVYTSLELFWNSFDNAPLSNVFYLERKVESEVGVHDIRSWFTPQLKVFYKKIVCFKRNLIYVFDSCNQKHKQWERHRLIDTNCLWGEFLKWLFTKIIRNKGIFSVEKPLRGGRRPFLERSNFSWH